MPATRLRIAPLALTLVCVNACRAPDGGQRALPAQPGEPARRMEEPRMWRAVIDALSDKRLPVREEAVLGIARWKPGAPDAAAADAALLSLAGPLAEGGREPELRWRVLFALARRKCVAARGTFKEALADPDPRPRIYALPALAAP